MAYALYHNGFLALVRSRFDECGRPEEGLILTETGVELNQGLTTPPVFWPLILALRAQVNAMAGRTEQALVLIDEAIRLGASEEVVFQLASLYATFTEGFDEHPLAMTRELLG